MSVNEYWSSWRVLQQVEVPRLHFGRVGKKQVIIIQGENSVRIKYGLGYRLKCALIQGKSQIYGNEVSDSNLVSKVNV